LLRFCFYTYFFRCENQVKDIHTDRGSKEIDYKDKILVDQCYKQGGLVGVIGIRDIEFKNERDTRYLGKKINRIYMGYLDQIKWDIG